VPANRPVESVSDNLNMISCIFLQYYSKVVVKICNYSPTQANGLSSHHEAPISPALQPKTTSLNRKCKLWAHNMTDRMKTAFEGSGVPVFESHLRSFCKLKKNH